MNQHNLNPWKTESSELKYENKWISLTEHKVLNPAGNPGIYGVVHFKNTAVGVIPVDADGNTWLVGQYRYPLGKYSWEIPEGGCPAGESTLECAARELEEETGLRAQNFTPILEMHLSNSVSDELAIIYLATGLSEHRPQPEETELLEIKKLTFDEAFKLLEEGEITDSMSVAGLLKVKWMIQNGQLVL